MIKVRSLILIVAMALALELQGQDDPAAASRAAQIQAEQARKATFLTPDEPSKTERLFLTAENTWRKAFRGSPVGIQTGGLPGGSGFAIGPLVQWKKNPGDRVYLSLSAVGSLRRSYKAGTGLHANFPDQSLGLTVQAVYTNASQLDYYGPGPDSDKG